MKVVRFASAPDGGSQFVEVDMPTDNASTDETPSVIAEFGDLPIVHRRRERNVGLVANWCGARDFLDGDFLQFLSDDDLLAFAHALPMPVRVSRSLKAARLAVLVPATGSKPSRRYMPRAGFVARELSEMAGYERPGPSISASRSLAAMPRRRWAGRTASATSGVVSST